MSDQLLDTCRDVREGLMVGCFIIGLICMFAAIAGIAEQRAALEADADCVARFSVARTPRDSLRIAIATSACVERLRSLPHG